MNFLPLNSAGKYSLATSSTPRLRGMPQIGHDFLYALYRMAKALRLVERTRRPKLSGADLDVILRELDDLFGKSDVRIRALLMVLPFKHPFILDYIKQAPVLVVQLMRNEYMGDNRAQLWISDHFTVACRKDPRLPQIMKYFGLAPQLRRLSGKALATTDRPILEKLSAIQPSTLAQIIPGSVSGQCFWMNALNIWVSHMERRFLDADLYFNWAAKNFGGGNTPATRDDITDIADFAGNNRTRFNEKWTLLQARAACNGWHAQTVVTRSSEMEFLAKYGIGWRTPINYAPLPLHFKTGGFEFVALRTGEQILIEKENMHHCVDTYIGSVLKGRSCLYSVRQDGRRVATLELLPSPGSEGAYSLGQLRGPYNAQVCPDILHAAERVLVYVNQKVAQPVQKPANIIRTRPLQNFIQPELPL